LNGKTDFTHDSPKKHFRRLGDDVYGIRIGKTIRLKLKSEVSLGSGV
jgi:hypothetical protein